MPGLTQHIDSVQISSINVLQPDGFIQSEDRLYGTAADGSIVELYNPFEHLPLGAYSASITPGSAVKIGSDLYFTIGYSYSSLPNLTPIGGASVFRMTQGGEVDFVALAPNTLPIASVQGSYKDAVPIATKHNGQYFQTVYDFVSDQYQIFQISPSGSVTQYSHFVRPSYPGASGGMVFVGETMFSIGDQQTPVDATELWRIAADGTQEIAFSNGRDAVVDVESFAGRAWFVRLDLNPFSTIGVLYTVGETGAAQKIDIGKGNDAIFLDTDAGGLVLAYSNTGFSGGNVIARVAADGTLTTLMDDSSIGAVYDVVGFAGEIYFIGFANNVAEEALFRVLADGSAELIGLPDRGIDLQHVTDLQVSGGKLWFNARINVPDGFGGFVEYEALMSLDDQGAVSVVSGVPGHYPGVLPTDTIDFTLDVPIPIFGTAVANSLLGTLGGERIYGFGANDTMTGLAGNDDIRGGAGNDSAFGGNGNDYLLGGAGNDSIAGGIGNDTLYGGAGNDSLSGGSGNDTLDGGDGVDQLSGGAGADVFLFIGDGATDTIMDFTLGSDLIYVGVDFGSLTITTFAAGVVHVRDDAGDLLVVKDSAGLLTAADFTAADFV